MTVHFLDIALEKAVDKILAHYAKSEFYTALGEEYVTVLRSMIKDGIKIGITLNQLANISIEPRHKEPKP